MTDTKHASLPPLQSAIECLQDVISHHDDFRSACGTRYHSDLETYGSDSAEYWGKQQHVLDRMKAQAETALPSVRAALAIAAAAPVATSRDEWPTDAATAVGHLAGLAFGAAPADEIGHCVGLIAAVIDAPVGEPVLYVRPFDIEYTKSTAPSAACLGYRFPEADWSTPLYAAPVPAAAPKAALVTALTAALEALENSEATHKHYKAAADRHHNACKVVRAALAAAGVKP